MKISDIFTQQAQTFSFEFFPPKDQISAVEFGINVGQLMKLDPSFVTVTYGAGGSTQDKTFELVDFFQNQLDLPTMAHYTCVNATKEKVENDIRQLKEKNIENLMLLRGDPPKGQKEFKAIPGGFKHAGELIKYVSSHKEFDFCIGAAAYAEKHVEAASMDVDLQNLKKKVEAGACFLVTQMFFDNNYYWDFLTKARNMGIECRIIPGLIPITNFKQIKKFAQLSGAKIPDKIIQKMEPYQDNKAKMYQIGLDIAIDQARDLLAKGAPGIHLYTLNKSRAAVEMYEDLSKDFREIKHKYEQSLTQKPMA